MVHKQEKNSAFIRENRGKYCYPNLKIHLKGLEVSNNLEAKPFIEYRMCLV